MYDQTLLQPFPTWADNAIGDAAALQSVLGFEIDAEDRIWVLDQGKVNGEAAIPGSQKLVVYDSNTGDQLMFFDLTTVTDPQRSFLNDVVVDTYRQIAYITDSGISVVPGEPIKGGIIVLDYANNRVRRVLDPDSSVEDDPSLWVTINGERVNAAGPMETGADGIALSCDGTVLFYTPLTSRTLYAIETSYLRDWNLLDLSPFVTDLGYKLSASDGLAASFEGSLYLTAIETNSIYRLSPYTEDPSLFDYHDFLTLASDPDLMMWPDTLGFDPTDHSLVFVSNQLHHFVGNTMDFLSPLYGEFNFRIWKVMVGDMSYVHGCSKGSNTSSSSGFPSWAIAVIVVGSFIIVALGGVACWKYRLAQKFDKEPLVPAKKKEGDPIN
jgi:sugar lactone lactonase YvrE